MSDFLTKVNSLKKEIKELTGQNNSRYEETRKELLNLGFLGSYGNMKLYYDHIEGNGRSLKIDSGIEAAAQVNGSVYTTTNVSGGGARPTLTRIAIGAAVAGPLGALIGGAAQKKKKIKTTNEIHDDRVYRVIVTSKDGYIEEVLNTPNPDPQTFVGKIINAIADYSENKEYFEAKRKELKALLKDSPEKTALNEKKEELKDILDNATDDEKEELRKYEKRKKIIGAIVLCAIIVFTFAIWYFNVKLLKETDSRTDASVSSSQQTQPTSNYDAHTIQLLKQCTVMEMADIINTGGDKDNAYKNARNFCETSLSSWGKKVFAEAIEIDWSKRKDEMLNGATLASQAAELKW